MKIPVAILEDQIPTKRYLTHLILKYCPYLDINWSINSITQFFKTDVSALPDIIFINPKAVAPKDIEAISSRPLNVQSILLMEPDCSRSVPLNFFSPSGYLYYPLDEELFILSVENARKSVEFRKNSLFRMPFRIQVGIPSSDGLDFVPKQDIIRCESLTNCTRIITASTHKSIISSYNIGEFKKLLVEPEFYCPHKSHLINLSFISKYKREGIILMKGDEKSLIPVSRNKRAEFLNLITRL